MSEDRKPPFDLTPQGIEKAFADGIARPATISEIAHADRLMAQFDQRIKVAQHNAAVELEKTIEAEPITETRIGIADGRVVVIYPKPIEWVAMSGDEAAAIAVSLMRFARQVGLSQPVTFEF